MDILKVKVNNEWVPIPAITGPAGPAGPAGATGAEGSPGAPGRDGKNGVTFSMTLTATASGWSNDTTPVQTLSAPGVTANDTDVYISLAPGATQGQRNAAVLARIVCTNQSADSLTFAALGEKPTIDIPLSVVVTGEEPGSANGVSF